MQQTNRERRVTAQQLGSARFREDYRLRYAYIVGSMYKGISSSDMVVRAAKAGLLSFLGTGGLTLTDIEANIKQIRARLDDNTRYGVNLLGNTRDPIFAMHMVDILLQNDVRVIEASAFFTMTPALVKYRLAGLTKDASAKIHCRNKVIAKVSRVEVARAFLQPAPENIVNELVAAGMISEQQREWARTIPMADDICVEADSGGHTDMGVAWILLPEIQRARDELYRHHHYRQSYVRDIGVGCAGGIGTPESAASAFQLNADFVATGSINQCTVEANTSDSVKTILQGLSPHDMDYAPAGDMFETGAKVQVVKKGSLFSARAKRLYELWRCYDSLDQISESTKHQLETHYFKRSFEAIYADTKTYYLAARPQEIQRAERDPKHKMALIFRWYFIYSQRIAQRGQPSEKENYQIHCGPALGAFNSWVKGSDLEPWQNRHVDLIAERLMHSTAQYLSEFLDKYC